MSTRPEHDEDVAEEVIDDVEDFVDPPGDDHADDRPAGPDYAADADAEENLGT